jgi:hypothetical protein
MWLLSSANNISGVSAGKIHTELFFKVFWLAVIGNELSN